MDTVAFSVPPLNDPHGATRAREMRPHRRRGSLTAPDTVWTLLGRAWFFIAGATAGILLAFALIAIVGTKRPSPRDGRIITSQANAVVTSR
jgi:hypothetical protein